MPAFKTSPDPPYEHHDIIPNGYVVFHGLLPAQCLHEAAGERHRLIVAPEEKSEAQIEWHNNKDGGGGAITACGQRVIFLHRQADFSLVWKREATLLWFQVHDDMLRRRDAAGNILAGPGISRFGNWRGTIVPSWV